MEWKKAFSLVGVCLALSSPSGGLTALAVDEFTLYELDLATGAYSPRGPVGLWGFHHVTLHGDVLFGATQDEFVGMSVHAIDSQTRETLWSVILPGLEFAEGIAYIAPFLYAAGVDYVGDMPTHYLAKLDPSTGGEISRIELQGLPLFGPYALATWQQQLWVLVPGPSWAAAHLASPETGLLGPGRELVGVPVATEAEFDSDGDLWVAEWRFDAIGFSWCTHYYELVGGAPAIERLVRCWTPPDPYLPPFYAVAILGGGPSPVTVPALGRSSMTALVLGLAALGVLALGRGRSWRQG